MDSRIPGSNPARAIGERAAQRSLLGVFLAGSTALDRAWSLLARVQAWFGVDEWREVQRRARVLDTPERAAALGRLTEAVARHPRSQALRVLMSAAREAPENARTGSRLADGTRPLNREARDETGRVLEQTVVAIALASEIDLDDVALLGVPVLSVVRDISARSDPKEPIQPVSQRR